MFWYWINWQRDLWSFTTINILTALLLLHSQNYRLDRISDRMERALAKTQTIIKRGV